MTANQVDTALAARAADVGSLILKAKEDQWFDRKSRKSAPKELAPALVAFANAEGGIVVIGLHGGTVEGMRRFPDKENDFRQPRSILRRHLYEQNSLELLV
jgi:ATP-dependent DNA helicase RecG